MRKLIHLTMFLLLLVIPQIANCQQEESLKKEINKIKRSYSYLYAETTMEDKGEALAVALDILQKEAERWAASKNKSGKELDLVLTNVTQRYSTMELRRGHMFRAFVYVKKSDIQLAQNSFVSEIKAETPKETDKETDSSTKPIYKPKLPEALQRLLTLKQMNEILPMLETLQKGGLITEYKRYAALSDPDAYVLVIYNRQEEVEAILSEGPNRMNIRTGQPDGVANYKGRGAMGVKLN